MLSWSDSPIFRHPDDFFTLVAGGWRLRRDSCAASLRYDFQPRAGPCLLRPIYKFVLKIRKIMHTGEAFFRPSPLFCEAVGVASGLPDFHGGLSPTKPHGGGDHS